MATLQTVRPVTPLDEPELGALDPGSALPAGSTPAATSTPGAGAVVPAGSPWWRQTLDVLKGVNWLAVAIGVLAAMLVIGVVDLLVALNGVALPLVGAVLLAGVVLALTWLTRNHGRAT